MSKKLEWALAWVIRLLRPIPNLAWAPFAIIWFGVDEAAAVFIISIGVFWIVFFAAQGAIRSVDRELIELANAFGELTDPAEQRRRFEADMDLKERIYGVRYPIDDALLAALALMPPTSGIALGFDRLVMLATHAPSIDQVVWTPFV